MPEEIQEWLKGGLREYHEDTTKLQDNRLNALNIEHDKINSRLSKLFDMKLDEAIDLDL